MTTAETGVACAKIRLMMETARPRPLLVRGLQAVSTKGVTYAVRRAAQLARIVERPAPPAPTAPVARVARTRRPDDTLALRAGETVEVKSAEEIRATLDERGMYRGLYFMGEMWRFCGQRMTVMKPVERIMVEATGELRTGIKSTVLLDGSTCDGSCNGGCDVSCYHLWREVWLRRVDASSAEYGSDRA